jgi:hypothetical protein
MDERIVTLLRPAARRLRRLKASLYHVAQRLCNAVGLNVVRARDFYSPLPVLSQLRRTRSRWDRPSRLAGVSYDLDAMKATLSSLLARYGDEYARQPSYDQNKRKGFGPGFTPFDAMVEYFMLRDLKPRRYLEVGSGLSTYYASLAAAKNAEEGQPTQIICIEPYPYKKLHTIPGIEIRAKEVQDVDVSFFGRLEAGDVLFIDSTHIVKLDSDVSYLYLEVLPALKRGVVVHIHDVPFPFNVPYPPDQWVFGMPWPMYWTEAMLVQAFLCFNPAFRIALSTPMIRYFDEAFLREKVPGYKPVSEDPKTFCSLWLERIA